MRLSAEDTNFLWAFPALSCGECIGVSLFTGARFPAVLCSRCPMLLLQSSSSSMCAATTVWNFRDSACTVMAVRPFACFSS